MTQNFPTSINLDPGVLFIKKYFKINGFCLFTAQVA